jgi:hypothetical protein
MGKPEEESLFGRCRLSFFGKYRLSWEDNITIDLKQI